MSAHLCCGDVDMAWVAHSPDPQWHIYPQGGDMEGAEWVAFANWPACLKYCWSSPNLMADWFCADLSYHASNPDPSDHKPDILYAGHQN